jgi:hypothetical protein
MNALHNLLTVKEKLHEDHEIHYSASSHLAVSLDRFARLRSRRRRSLQDQVRCLSWRRGSGENRPGREGDQITDLLTKGEEAKKAPHKKAMAGLSADDAKAVAEYVKTLK